jgi:anti-sigma-K factor RskA
MQSSIATALTAFRPKAGTPAIVSNPQAEVAVVKFQVNDAVLSRATFSFVGGFNVKARSLFLWFAPV